MHRKLTSCHLHCRQCPSQRPARGTAEPPAVGGSDAHLLAPSLPGSASHTGLGHRCHDLCLPRGLGLCRPPPLAVWPEFQWDTRRQLLSITSYQYCICSEWPGRPLAGPATRGAALEKGLGVPTGGSHRPGRRTPVPRGQGVASRASVTSESLPQVPLGPFSGSRPTSNTSADFSPFEANGPILELGC